MAIFNKKVFKSKTNRGDYAKQYFIFVKNRNEVCSLIIIKRVLSHSFGLYGKDYRLLRIYKGQGLFEKVFAIKLSTLSWLFRSCPFIKEF